MVLEYYPQHFTSLIFLFLFTIFFFTIGIYYFLKYPRYQDTFAKAFILLIVVLLCTYGVKKSLQHSEKLWVVRGGTELVIINAAHTFAEKGFATNYGLPDYSSSYYARNMSTNFKLTRVLSSEIPDPRIYTHTPPGSSWLVGSFVKVCGNDNLSLSCLRILSTVSASLALLFFAVMAYSALGPLKSTVLIFFIAIIPMTRNMIWTLHYHNYAFSLFLILVGFLLYFFKKKRKFKMSTAIILFILSFIQGWVAYEYFALTLFSPISFALIYSQLDIKEDRKRLFLAILFLAIGFLSAAGLHFIQNAIYFGGISETVVDIFQRLETRSLSKKPLGWSWEPNRTWMSLWYFFVFPRSWFFFIINFPILLSVCLVLVWFKDISITIKKPINVSFKWVSSIHNYFAILTAFLISYLFIFVLFNSVAGEAPHMARILFFAYFVCILTILECIRSVVPNNQ